MSDLTDAAGKLLAHIEIHSSMLTIRGTDRDRLREALSRELEQRAVQITDGQIEKAAAAIYGQPLPGLPTHAWGQASSEQTRRLYRNAARAALEAASGETQ